jgi:hypothetical protein
MTSSAVVASHRGLDPTEPSENATAAKPAARAVPERRRPATAPNAAIAPITSGRGAS